MQTDLITLFKNKKLSTIKMQVRYLYDNFPATIKDDRALYIKFLEYFHDLTPDKSYKYVMKYIRVNKLNYASVTRSGRWWRANFPTEYPRDETETLKAEAEYKETFRCVEV